MKTCAISTEDFVEVAETGLINPKEADQTQDWHLSHNDRSYSHPRHGSDRKGVPSIEDSTNKEK